MYICNFIEEGRYGGPQARITLIAAALEQHNIITYVVFSQYDSEKFRNKLDQNQIKNLGLDITRLSMEKKIFTRYIFTFFIDIYRLYFFFKKNKFDIIHVNGAHQIKGPIAAKLARIPVIWHLNDTRPNDIIRNSFSFIAKICADGFIVAGQKVYDLYLKSTPLTAKPCSEIHAPVDISFFDPKKIIADQRLSRIHGLKLLTVCNISYSKGLNDFVDMAACLNNKNKDLSFYIAGPVYDSQQHYFQKLKSNIDNKNIPNINMLGKVDNIAALLQGADIFIFCSYSEASPTVIWEAMSMGKAIVTTDVGSVSQYVKDGVSGFIVPTKDALSLSRKVQILIENPALRKKMGVAARDIAKAMLDVSRAAERHACFYQQILEAKK